MSSGLPPGSESSGSVMSTEETIAMFRDFIQKSKSLSGSPEEASSSKGSVSEGFVSALTEQEIREMKQKLFNYWEKTAEKDSEVIEPKVTKHEGSDPKAQCEEAVTSFEDAKSESLRSPQHQRLHNIGKLVEKELRNIREAKLSEGFIGEPEIRKLHRSENIDFTDLKKKAAELPGVADSATTKIMRHLPVIMKTDPLEMILKIYESGGADSGGMVKYDAAKASVDISFAPKMTKDQQFQSSLISEMSSIHERLERQSRSHPIPEEPEGENSSSSDLTKDSTLSRSYPTTPLDFSASVYPGDTTRSSVPTPIDNTMSSHTLDSNSSASGLVNEPQFSLPKGAQKESSNESSEGSSGKTATSSMTVCSDETLSNISSLPTDTTSGARASLSSLRDVEGLPMSLSRPQLQFEDEAFEPQEPTGPMDVPPLDPGPLNVPGLLEAPALPLSLDSTENAEVEDRARRRRDRSPREDEEDKNAPKRQAH